VADDRSGLVSSSDLRPVALRIVAEGGRSTVLCTPPAPLPLRQGAWERTMLAVDWQSLAYRCAPPRGRAMGHAQATQALECMLRAVRSLDSSARAGRRWIGSLNLPNPYTVRDHLRAGCSPRCGRLRAPGIDTNSDVIARTRPPGP